MNVLGEKRKNENGEQELPTFRPEQRRFRVWLGRLKPVFIREEAYCMDTEGASSSEDHRADFSTGAGSIFWGQSHQGGERRPLVVIAGELEAKRWPVALRRGLRRGSSGGGEIFTPFNPEGSDSENSDLLETISKEFSGCRV